MMRAISVAASRIPGPEPAPGRRALRMNAPVPGRRRPAETDATCQIVLREQQWDYRGIARRSVTDRLCTTLLGRMGSGLKTPPTTQDMTASELRNRDASVPRAA